MLTIPYIIRLGIAFGRNDAVGVIREISIPLVPEAAEQATAPNEPPFPACGTSWSSEQNSVWSPNRTSVVA